MRSLRSVGILVAAALLLLAPSARAECAKATALRPCPKVGAARLSARRTVYPVWTQAQARSMGLIVGGLGSVLVGLAGFGLAYVASTPCSEHNSEPCPDGEPYLYLGVVVGVLGVAGGTAMIYYGALDAPVVRPQPATLPPWTLPPSRGVTLRLRF